MGCPTASNDFCPEANDAGGGAFCLLEADDSPILNNPTPSGSLGRQERLSRVWLDDNAGRMAPHEQDNTFLTQAVGIAYRIEPRWPFSPLPWEMQLYTMLFDAVKFPWNSLEFPGASWSTKES